MDSASTLDQAWTKEKNQRTEQIFAINYITSTRN
jgi:hypothetical protein